MLGGEHFANRLDIARIAGNAIDGVRGNHNQPAIVHDFNSFGKGFVGNGANLAHDTSLE